MILRLIACVFLVVLILYTATMLAEKIRDILEEGNYNKMCERYLSQTGQVLKRIEDLGSFSKRLEKFETDFKTHGGLLENRLADIESVLNTGRTPWQVRSRITMDVQNATLVIQRSRIRRQSQNSLLKKA